jgi:tetratricopeptide (TPR) repeat protein
MMLARTGAVLCLLLLTPRPALGQDTPAQSNPATVEIVLAMPFESQGAGARLVWLGEGLAELTARRMSSARRVVLPRAEWIAAAERLGLGPSARISRASLLRIAEQADADLAVFGSFSLANGQLTLTAQGLRLDGPQISPPFTESGPLDQFVETHARLCWRLLRFFDPLLPVSRLDFARAATRLRLDAFENYSRGLLAFGPERLRLLREAARLEPEWSDAAFALGQAYLEADNFEAALIWLSRVPPASAFGLEAGFYAGLCHLLRNDAPRAEAALRAILERPWYPGNSSPAARRMDLPEVLNNLAIALSRQGQWPEARRLWTQARQLAPAEPSFAFNFALGAFRVGDLDAAASALREALRLRPDEQARALLAAILDKAGKKDEAASERAACQVANCGNPPEVAALFVSPESAGRGRKASGATPPANPEVAAGERSAASAQAAAQLDRPSITLDLVTWFLSGQSRPASPGSRDASRQPLSHTTSPRLQGRAHEAH